jgi:peptidyl-dipeptidase A
LTLLLIALCATFLWVDGAVAQERPATVEDARAFIERAEEEITEFNEFAGHVFWIRATYINHDSNWLATKVGAEGTQLGVRLANEAKRFDGLDLPEDVARKLALLKMGLTLPAPETEGAAEELSEIRTRLVTTYSTGKIDLDGEQVPGVDLEEMMGTVRDPDRLQEMWTKWREISPVMHDDYARLVEIANEGARELGFSDVGALWRSKYDMPPDAFAEEADRLWTQVKPLYDQLQCHVRAKLNENYGDEIVPLDQPIRADLLGNMWAQDWANIYDLVAPEGADVGYDLTEILVGADYDAHRIVETGEAFFASLGFEELPETFWERSLITKPRDREVVCHASAWNVDDKDDVRIKMCTKVNAEDFRVVHHELGHNFYQRAYKEQSPILQGGANDGFHEAIGDMIALSITPEYLQQIELIEEVPEASGDLGLLMQRALDKVSFLPFGLLVDKWRWKVFSGELTPETYNEGWWTLRTGYQGVRPPTTREDHHFDPGAKFHIPNNTPYTRYFLAHILQFQFHKAACEMAGWEGPLHRCSIYGSEDVGARFNAMLEMGMSRPWPEALEAFTATDRMDGSAVVEYFAPLMTWLEEQNAGRQCGW